MYIHDLFGAAVNLRRFEKDFGLGVENGFKAFLNNNNVKLENKLFWFIQFFLSKVTWEGEAHSNYAELETRNYKQTLEGTSLRLISQW